MIAEGRSGTRGCEALAVGAGLRGLASLRGRRLDTLRSQQASSAITGEVGGELGPTPGIVTITSSRPAVRGRGDRPIRKKIIGHGMPALLRRLAGSGGLQRMRRPLALFHQPAREHGTGVFFKPLIEKRADLLAEIGSMAKPREFVALERSARSREKELPRRLSLLIGHRGLLENNLLTVTR